MDLGLPDGISIVCGNMCINNIREYAQNFLDIKDYDQWYGKDTIDRVYKLKNPQTDSIECIIETKRFAERKKGFKMEIS